MPQEQDEEWWQEVHLIVGNNLVWDWMTLKQIHYKGWLSTSFSQEIKFESNRETYEPVSGKPSVSDFRGVYRYLQFKSWVKRWEINV